MESGEVVGSLDGREKREKRDEQTIVLVLFFEKTRASSSSLQRQAAAIQDSTAASINQVTQAGNIAIIIGSSELRRESSRRDVFCRRIVRRRHRFFTGNDSLPFLFATSASLFAVLLYCFSCINVALKT